MNTRRITGLITSVVLALVGTLAIVAYVKGADDRAQAGEKIVKVLTVKTTVPAGTSAKDLGASVGLESISRKVMADGAVTSVKSLGKKVAGTTLVAGEQVIASRFVDKSNFSATGADVQVPPGLLRTSVALDPQRVIGGVLTPGARVAVIASFDPFDMNNQAPITIDGIQIQPNGKTPTSTHIILHKALVINVQLTGNLNNTENTSDAKTADTAKPGQAPTSQLLVTLALDGPSTERLVFAQEFGKVWLSIEPADVSDAPTAVETRGSVYR